MKRRLFIFACSLLIISSNSTIFAQKGSFDFYLMGGWSKSCLESYSYPYKGGGNSGIGIKYHLKDKLYFTSELAMSMSSKTTIIGEGNRACTYQRQDYRGTMGIGYDIINRTFNNTGISVYIQGALGIGNIHSTQPYQWWMDGDNMPWYNTEKKDFSTLAVSPAVGFDYKIKDMFKIGVTYVGHYLWGMDYNNSVNLKISFVFD